MPILVKSTAGALFDIVCGKVYVVLFMTSCLVMMTSYLDSQ